MQTTTIQLPASAAQPLSVDEMCSLKTGDVIGCWREFAVNPDGGRAYPLGS